MRTHDPATCPCNRCSARRHTERAEAAKPIEAPPVVAEKVVSNIEATALRIRWRANALLDALALGAGETARDEKEIRKILVSIRDICSSALGHPSDAPTITEFPKEFFR